MIQPEQIIYNDSYITVVNKPHGLQGEPDRKGNPDLCTELKRYFNKQNKPPKILQPVNRLDRPVAGLVLFAKTATALKILNKKQENREITKIYTALVEGVIQPQVGELNHFIEKDVLHKKAIIHLGPTASSKRCKLDYKTIDIQNSNSRIEIRLHTGRYHQIRAQLSFVGHPIVGDAYYGASQLFIEQGICLQATQLIFRHPITDEQISLSSFPVF